MTSGVRYSDCHRNSASIGMRRSRRDGGVGARGLVWSGRSTSFTSSVLEAIPEPFYSRAVKPSAEIDILAFVALDRVEPKIFVDTDARVPHIGATAVDAEYALRWRAAHPETVQQMEAMDDPANAAAIADRLHH